MLKKTVFMLFLFQTLMYAQDTLVVNIDHDLIPDKVWIAFEEDDGYIYAKLSAPNKIFKSKPMGDPSGSVHFTKAKNGFHFKVNFMRGGFGVQFRYNDKTKEIEAIGLSRYEFGNAANDGSGESSINLNTHKYIGNWHYYDLEKEALIKMAPIQRTLKFSTQNLVDFDGAIVGDFMDQCAALYTEEKAKHIKK
ncbi:hypothetical protein [Aureibaculum flavum]|nr:hypothetical protein [Aureibaculum flavum]